jgi:hypothetical protein
MFKKSNEQNIKIEQLGTEFNVTEKTKSTRSNQYS